MTADTITAIKKALEGVTPGPWELCAHLKHNDACSCGYRGVIYGPEPNGYAICQPGHEPAPEGQEGTEPQRYPRNVEIANMRYIAAINPEAISELLATLEILQRKNEELKNLIDGDNCADPDKIDALFRRAETAEAEVKRLTYLLEKVAPPEFSKSWLPPQDYEMIRAALSSTGDTHGN